MEDNKNLKLYPKYRKIAMDFLFFYTINVLFLTEVKHISMSAVVLVDTLYAFFSVIVQIPASALINKIGRKNSMILGNILDAIYLIVVINSTGLYHLLIAEVLCAAGFALKEGAEPAILNSSINLEKEEKSKLFSKIQGKAVSGYFFLRAGSMILAGFLFEINGYIPMYLSLFVVIIGLIMSTQFEVTEEKIDKRGDAEEKVSFKEAIKFANKSNRCKSLLLYSSIFYGIIIVLATYEISLLEDLGVSSRIIGVAFAILNLVSAFSSKMENDFQNTFKNRTLTVIGILLVFSCMLSGGVSIVNIPLKAKFLIIFIMYIIKFACVGLYNVFLIKYLSNFTNRKIDAQIFSINNFMISIFSIVFGVLGSVLLEYFNISKSMMIFGAISLIIMVWVLIYMRHKVGLKPEEYSKEELKYDVKI